MISNHDHHHHQADSKEETLIYNDSYKIHTITIVAKSNFPMNKTSTQLLKHLVENMLILQMYSQFILLWVITNTIMTIIVVSITIITIIMTIIIMKIIILQMYPQSILQWVTLLWHTLWIHSGNIKMLETKTWCYSHRQIICLKDKTSSSVCFTSRCCRRLWPSWGQRNDRWVLWWLVGNAVKW